MAKIGVPKGEPARQLPPPGGGEIVPYSPPPGVSPQAPQYEERYKASLPPQSVVRRPYVPPPAEEPKTPQLPLGEVARFFCLGAVLLLDGVTWAPFTWVPQALGNPTPAWVPYVLILFGVGLSPALGGLLSPQYRQSIGRWYFGVFIITRVMMEVAWLLALQSTMPR